MSLMGDDPSESHEVNGTAIRFLWYDGGRLTPLWDAGTVLAKDADWLRLVLGIRDTLIRELTAWTETREIPVRWWRSRTSAHADERSSGGEWHYRRSIV